MKAFKRYAALLGFALVSAQAQAVEFSFTSGAAVPPAAFGNTYSATTDGLTLTASAWSDTAGSKKTRVKLFESAALTVAPDFGMGVCNQDGKLTCASKNNDDALGNKGADDLILFSFSSTVSLQSLTAYQLGKDADLSVWAGIGTFSPGGMSSSAIGTATPYQNANTVAGIRIVDLSTFTGSYDWLAVAARIGHSDDFAKLTSLTVTPVTQAVPDAASWMTMLAGLGLVGFAVKRRTRT
ncbi:PEP-CTERM sorting domain-containing protein [Thiobacillus sp.]